MVDELVEAHLLQDIQLATKSAADVLIAEIPTPNLIGCAAGMRERLPTISAVADLLRARARAGAARPARKKRLEP